MGYKWAPIIMKRRIMIALLALASIFAFAVPNGCYDGASGMAKGRKCAIHISGSELSLTNKSGEVIARWEITSDSDGVLYLKSAYGATATAKWWREGGEVYISMNGMLYVHD